MSFIKPRSPEWGSAAHPAVATLDDVNHLEELGRRRRPAQGVDVGHEPRLIDWDVMLDETLAGGGLGGVELVAPGGEIEYQIRAFR